VTLPVTDAIPLLLHNLVLIFGVMIVLWGVAVAIRDVSFIDAVWPMGMVLLAATTFWLTNAASPASLLLLALTMAWGLRLGMHLFIRWRRNGVDPRYARIIASAKDKKGWSFAKTALLQVFLLQGPLLFMVCLPAQLGIWRGGEAGALALVGTLLAITGIAFETIGDWQLERFRADAANRGKVLNTGLWRYTRHPNYFGDACTWWGMWLIALSTGWDVGLASLIGPVFLNFTLVKWSGAAMLERGLKKTRPEYADYIARTSAFFPLPPKKA
jgi:steroid 5-alpha reductase family enzyme